MCRNPGLRLWWSSCRLFFEFDPAAWLKYTSWMLCRPPSPASRGPLKRFHWETGVMRFTLCGHCSVVWRRTWKGQGWWQDQVQEGRASCGHRRGGRGDWSLNQSGCYGTGKKYWIWELYLGSHLHMHLRLISHRVREGEEGERHSDFWLQQLRRWWCWSFRKKRTKESVLQGGERASCSWDVLSFRYQDVLLEISHGQWEVPVWSWDPGSELS